MTTKFLRRQPDNQALKITNGLFWNRKKWPLWKLETGHSLALLAARALRRILWAVGRVGEENSWRLNGVFAFAQPGPGKVQTNWSKFREE